MKKSFWKKSFRKKEKKKREKKKKKEKERSVIQLKGFVNIDWSRREQKEKKRVL